MRNPSASLPALLAAALAAVALTAAQPLQAQDEEAPTSPAPAADSPAQAPADAQEEAGASSESPSETPEPSEDGEPKSAPKAFLKIETDLECLVTVAPEPARRLLPGEVLELEVNPGTGEVRATALAAPEAAVVESYDLEEDDRQRFKLKMAKALSDLRKLEARERTYRDIETRMMWPTVDNGKDVTWSEARTFCVDLQHGGWGDWRLPSVEELDSLQEMWSLRSYKTPNPINLTACCPWSSERTGETKALNYNFRFRRPFEGQIDYSYDLRALCVRDGSDEIPENTRKNRREAKRQAKERQREKARAAAAAAAAAREADSEEDPEKDDDGGG